MRMNFDFNDLEAFLAVKQSGSFQVAADRLNLSQSAVTRRIKKLEHALDSLLFERTTRAVRPTLAAKRLEARAEAMLEGARETTRAMRDETAASAHQRNMIVTVAILPTVAALILTKGLHTFRTEGHLARVRVLDRAANGVAEAVAQAEADFGVCSIPMLEPSTSFEPLFEDQIVLAMQPGHPLAKLELLHWSNLTDETLILPSQGTGNRMLIDEALARLELPVTWAYEVGRSTTALQMAAAGIGVALLPRSTVSSGLEPSVIVRPIAGPEIARPIGFISRIGQSDLPAVSALKSALRAAMSIAS